MSADNLSYDEANIAIETQPKSCASRGSESDDVKAKSTLLFENLDRFIIQRRFTDGEGIIYITFMKDPSIIS